MIKGKAQDLSHAGLYHFDDDDTEPIPTPALLPGLLGLGVAALRQRNGKVEESTDA
ncbi:MAG: PTPA-CTERM sorting domain-containing protein [Leptolyngbyaceae cyanobacterium SM2_5_2]|nr:PTPA-CTERM sorting domain-containing protein [Leptolyngbyaceae cyanobacterium SM2_5_2]